MAHLMKLSKNCQFFNVNVCYYTAPLICFYFFCEIVANEENLMCVNIIV